MAKGKGFSTFIFWGTIFGREKSNPNSPAIQKKIK
jgi:hypothetical protein